MKKYIKDCLLFGNSEFALLGVLSWLTIACMLVDTSYTAVLIVEYFNK